MVDLARSQAWSEGRPQPDRRRYGRPSTLGPWGNETESLSTRILGPHRRSDQHRVDTV